MKKSKILLTAYLLILQSGLSVAQMVVGFVSDDYGNPIIGASVYFDGTTIGTITNKQGAFRLKPPGNTNSQLVIRSMGYETRIIKAPFHNQEHHVILTPKTILIPEVVVRPDPFTRKQKMKAFRREFFGKDRAGRLCYIENEDDIILYFSQSEKILKAIAHNPLTIVNPYLGYSIEFNLVEFYVKFNAITLKEEFSNNSLFLATTFFKDLQPDSKKIAKRRMNAYEGSQLNFFRTLSENKWGKDGFSLFDGSMPVNPHKVFEIIDTLGIKQVIITPQPSGASMVMGTDTIRINKRRYSILFRQKQQSVVKFDTNEFYIDALGNCSHPQSILFGGDMGMRRVGNLLPLNFGMDIKLESVPHP